MYAEGIDTLGISSYYGIYDTEDAVCTDEPEYYSGPATPYSLSNIFPPPETSPVSCNCSDIELSPLAEEILGMEESSEGTSAILERMGYGTAETLLRDALAAEGANRELLSAQSIDAFSSIYDQLVQLEQEFGFIPELTERVAALKDELRVQVNSLGQELGPEAQAITDEIQDDFDDSESYQPAPEVAVEETEVCYTSSGLEFHYIPEALELANEADEVVQPDPPAVTEEQPEEANDLVPPGSSYISPPDVEDNALDPNEDGSLLGGQFDLESMPERLATVMRELYTRYENTIARITRTAKRAIDQELMDRLLFAGNKLFDFFLN